MSSLVGLQADIYLFCSCQMSKNYHILDFKVSMESSHIDTSGGELWGGGAFAKTASKQPKVIIFWILKCLWNYIIETL